MCLWVSAVPSLILETLVKALFVLVALSMADWVSLLA